MKTNKFIDLDALPGFLIRRAHQLSSAILMEEFGSLGITSSQFLVLNSVAAAPHSEPKMVASTLGFDGSTMTLVTTKLIREGFILSKRHPGDARRKTFLISEKGKQILELARIASKRAIKRQLSAFSSKDADIFLEMLRLFINNTNCQFSAGEPPPA